MHYRIILRKTEFAVGISKPKYITRQRYRYTNVLHISNVCRYTSTCWHVTAGTW